MSKMSKAVSEMNENNSLRRNETVTNFMNGESYKLDPLDTLEMIAASSIFGEASYYRTDKKDGIFRITEEFTDEITRENFWKFNQLSTTAIFTKAIDDALTYDFEGTLNLAVKLRSVYNMRLNPQIIIVRASIHPNRENYTKANPGKFKTYVQKVSSRADDVLSQLTYYLYINNGKKNNIPSVLKRAICWKLSNLSHYEVNKYKNHEIGIINAVRLTHAHSPVLDELMRGTLTLIPNDQTWEQKRSAGMSWKDIVESTNMGHMALLRNLRNVFSEVEDREFCINYLNNLKNGVIKGKQFPFRYWSAYKTISDSIVNHKQLIMDSLEECIDISIDNNLPHLSGKTMCLSDNSGSAWGAFNSEYGSVTIAEIDNLSSVITAVCSDEGYVGKFGDRLKIHSISKRNGIIKQASDITKKEYDDVGASTEGGIWEFFINAINNKEWWDNIFIFSDQQAGTGGLYGDPYQVAAYKKLGYSCRSRFGMINVFKLIQDYRKKVNPKVNVFSIQTAGYNNSLVPQMSYRTAMLTGWTGKEILFASEYIDQWNKIDNKYFSNKGVN